MKLRKEIRIGLLILSVIGLFVSCNKEETPEADPIIGTYIFSSAQFNEAVFITIQGIEIEFVAGADASQFVGPSLLGAAPCDNPQNAAVELRDGGTVFFVCLTEANEAQMGTWSINSGRTVLTINISNPQPFQLDISNLDITSTTFSGTVTTFPLPKDTSLALGAPLPGGGLNYQTASISASFTRVP